MTIKKKPLTILIVDDDIPLSLYYKQTLLKDDHRVFVAINEHGALEVLKNERVDILLCDYVLPGMDGTQIIKIVKEQHQRTFCVLISGYQEKLFSDTTTPVNADLMIVKPIYKETLDDIIRQYHLKYSEV